MKLVRMEETIEENLNYIKTTRHKDKEGLRGKIYVELESDYDKAVLMTLRGSGINMSEYFRVALWEYEHILEEIVKRHTPFILDLIKEDNKEVEEV